MANNNLTTIKLGAPSHIKGGVCPLADLTVQIMENCGELSLNDKTSKCTKYGSIKTAAKLIGQLLEERSVTESADGCEIVYTNENYADVIASGGSLGLSMKVNGSAVKALYFMDVIDYEGTEPTISGNVVTCNNFANVKIKAVDVTNKENVAFKNIVFCLSYDIEYKELVDEFPDFIYSLVESDNTPWLHDNGTTSSAYIDLGIKHTAGNYYEADVMLIRGSENHLIFGTISGTKLGLAGNSGGKQGWWVAQGNEVGGLGGSITKNEKLSIVFKPSTKKLTVNGTEISASSSNEAATTTNLYLFYVNGWTASWGRSEVAISKFVVKNSSGEVLHKFIPFKRNNVYGMIDLVTKEFYQDKTGNNGFTYTLE